MWVFPTFSRTLICFLIAIFLLTFPTPVAASVHMSEVYFLDFLWPEFWAIVIYKTASKARS